MTTPIHPASSQGDGRPSSSVAAHGGEKGQHLLTWATIVVCFLLLASGTL